MSDDLPMGWVDLPLELVGMPSTPNIDPSKFSNEIFELYSVPSYTDDEPEILPSSEIHSTKQSVEMGDVLLCKIVPHLNRVWIVKELLQHRQIASGEWIVIRSKIAISDYLRYALTDSNFRSAFMATSSGVGGSLMRARPKAVAQIPIPIAPLNEQRRIVDKLERIGDRHLTARNELSHIPKLIARYKQAVLTAACSGKLTEDWRQTTNQKPWIYKRAADVCEKVQSGGTPREGFIQGLGIPFLKVYNIVDQKIAFEDRPQFVTESIHNGVLAKSRTQPNDVLMNIVGPPLGKVAIVPDSFSEWNINQAITLFRPSKDITTEFIYYFLCSGISTSEIINETRGSAGQVNISLSQCRDFIFPVPSLEEQKEIVRRVEKMFEKIDMMEQEYQKAAKLCDRLEQATLAKAFRGELVPQAPDDEPASVLLEQVKSQKEKGKIKTKK